MLKKTECWSLCLKDDVLSNYCDNWQLDIDVNKTKSMIFKQNYIKTEPSFVYYRNNQIQNVSEYPFLGITLKSNGQDLV
jgi:hypothetical protein